MLGSSSSSSEAHDRYVRLDDPDAGRGLFERLYEVPKIDVRLGPERVFDWRWKISQRGSATIIRGQALSGSVTLTGVTPQAVLVMVSAGSVQLSTSGQTFDVLPDRTACLCNAGMEVMAKAAGVRTLNLRFDPAALTSHAAALVGAPVKGPLRFDPFMDLRSDAGADILRLARFLEEACARPSSPLGSPHVIAHLREALYGAILIGQKSSLSHLLQRQAPLVDSRAVKRAEEILAARAAEPITIAEVAELTGIGLRSLERSFKAARGCSLRDFLKAQRLELAHRRLCSAAPGTTVTQVLHASGFSHPGEFSLAYRKRYGEAPSETLRRADKSRVVSETR